MRGRRRIDGIEVPREIGRGAEKLIVPEESSGSVAATAQQFLSATRDEESEERVGKVELRRADSAERLHNLQL